MHLAYVCHSYFPYDKPESLLEAHFTTTDWAEALSKAGVQVSVLYRFHRDTCLEKNGVSYFFFKDRLPPEIRAWHLPWTFHQQVAKYVKTHKVDIIHSHNAFTWAPQYSLRRQIPQIPIIVQDHSGLQRLRRPWLLRWCLRGLDGLMFAAPGQEKIWVQHRIIPREKCFFVMENSSHFQYKDRAEARTKTGWHGAPILLWVGNLNENKDPFTALRAFERILPNYPNARLYMIYRFAPLREKVEAFLSKNPRLKETVFLLGKQEREELPLFYNSADILLAASHKEGSGYAVIEAISCGVTPVLSDIPSFHWLTKNEQTGKLFEVGNDEMMANKIKELLKIPLNDLSSKTHTFFQENWSFDAIARGAKHVYEGILA